LQVVFFTLAEERENYPTEIFPIFVLTDKRVKRFGRDLIARVG
jgi:hypothetical protein